MAYQNQFYGWHKETPYAPTYTGTFERTVRVGERERRFLIYLPEDLRSATACVFVLGENGKTADDILKESLWTAMADTEISLEKMIVVALEPENGVWNTNEVYGCPDGDVAYVKAVCSYWGAMDVACMHVAKLYLLGCREGGVIAHMAAMWDPANIAGLVSIGGSAVPQAYMTAAKNDLCVDLHYIPVPELGIRKGEVAVPTWIIHDPTVPCGTGDAIEEYWRGACETAASPRQIAPDTWEYVRTKELPYPKDCDKEAFCVRVSTVKDASENHGYRMLQRAWKDFLFRHRRWAGNPCGDLQMTREPVRDLGMEYHFEHIAGYDREWYVYVPEQVKVQPHKEVPLVFALHGMQCSGAIYAEDTGWWKVADKYGFIVVFPSAINLKLHIPAMGIGAEEQVKVPGWNFLQKEGPEELAFFRELLERTATSYKIDRTRVYATGHSHGSIMTQTLGMSMTEVFAAIAPCSGVLIDICDGRDVLKLPEIVNRPDMELPCWMFSGDFEAGLFEMLPTDENSTGVTIAEWRKINHIGPAFPENWEVGWNTHGRWHDLEYISESGDPVVRYTWIQHLPHAVIVDQSFRIWEEFFAKYQRVDGQICVIKGNE